LLANYCRNKTCRQIARNFGARWEALRVDNVETGLPYGDTGAWALVADSIEDMNIAIRELTLNKPLGAKAYWWLIPRIGRASIYVKIQISSGGCSVLGRSFHLAEFEET
jgi:hypothetical protein